MKLRTLLFICLCLALIQVGPSSAQAIPDFRNGVVQTYNGTSYKVWITVYDLGKTRHEDYGFMDPDSARSWTSGRYLAGSIYHVRGEVKKMVDGQERTIFDTSIQITLRTCYTSYGTHPYGFGAVKLRKGTGESFYWETTENDFCPL